MKARHRPLLSKSRCRNEVKVVEEQGQPQALFLFNEKRTSKTWKKKAVVLSPLEKRRLKGREGFGGGNTKESYPK